MINVTAEGASLWLTVKIKNVTTRSHESISLESIQRLGSVSSRECLDAPAILATFTAGRTGLVACP